MKFHKFAFLLLLTAPALATAQSPKLSKEVREFVSVDAPVVVLRHVRVIDGTGAAPKEDQTLVISGGKIQGIGPAASMAAPAGAKEMELSGYTVIPGLVGMTIISSTRHLAAPRGRPAGVSRSTTRWASPFRASISPAA